MPLTPTTANTILNYKAGLCAYLSVHTADPGTSGTSEATGGSYARQQLNAWPAASAGSTTHPAKTFTPGAGGYTHGGYWSAATGGTFLGSFQFTTAKTGLTAGDTLTVTPTLTQNET